LLIPLGRSNEVTIPFGISDILFCQGVNALKM
jgi:hypothetical protein